MGKIGHAHGFILVFRNHAAQRQARARQRVLIGVTQAHAEKRHHIFGQIEQFGHAAHIVAQAADIHAAQPQRFGGQNHVLRHNAGINGTDERHFAPAHLGIGRDLLVFGKVHAKHQKFGAGFDVVLVGADRAQAFADFGVGDAHDVHGL